MTSNLEQNPETCRTKHAITSLVRGHHTHIIHQKIAKDVIQTIYVIT